MRGRTVLLLCLAPAAQACELPGGPVEKLQSAAHTILYRVEPALEVGKHFALELAVCPPPGDLRVDAWMPEHRHGMNYRPSLRPLGEGRYRAEGLMFHMPGRWEFLFEVRGAGKTERFGHGLQLK